MLFCRFAGRFSASSCLMMKFSIAGSEASHQKGPLMLPKKITSILWGILAFLPLVGFIVAGQLSAGSIDIQDISVHPEKIMSSLLLSLGAAFLWGTIFCYAIVGIFIIHMFAQKDVTPAFRTKWVILLLVFCFITTIVYWYRHILKKNRGQRDMA